MIITEVHIRMDTKSIKTCHTKLKATSSKIERLKILQVNGSV